LGTPAYMSPEQISGDVDSIGPASDIYSLGVILYEMLTAQLPFEGTLGAMAAKILLEPPPPPSQFRPGLNAELEAVCLKAMAKKPAERFASMKEFAAALEPFARDRGAATVAANLKSSPGNSAGAIVEADETLAETQPSRATPATTMPNRVWLLAAAA